MPLAYAPHCRSRCRNSGKILLSKGNPNLEEADPPIRRSSGLRSALAGAGETPSGRKSARADPREQWASLTVGCRSPFATPDRRSGGERVTPSIHGCTRSSSNCISDRSMSGIIAPARIFRARTLGLSKRPGPSQRLFSRTRERFQSRRRYARSIEVRER